MPKIIKGVRETILNCAKYHILDVRDSKLSLRQIANECNISVGTIYNYFPDKESLLAAVITNDWVEMLNELDDKVQTCDSIQEGILAIYDTLHTFKDIYVRVFEQFLVNVNQIEISNQRHAQLRDELEIRVHAVLNRFHQEETPDIRYLICETIISCAIRDELGKEMLWNYLGRILQVEEQ